MWVLWRNATQDHALVDNLVTLGIWNTKEMSMSLVTPIMDRLPMITLNPASRLEAFRRDQKQRDRAIQESLAKKLYLASLLDRLTNSTSSS